MNENLHNKENVFPADLIQNLLLTVILVVATAYRFYGLDQYGLWGHELANITQAVNLGWFQLMQFSIHYELSPPGYLSLVYLQNQLLGGSEFALRFLPVLSGIGSVWMVALLGRRCGSTSAGLLAAALLAGTPLAIRFSQEAQFCSIFTFLVLAQCYTFLGVFSQKKNALPGGNALLYSKASNSAGTFSVSWQPAVDVPAFCLLMFWLCSILMFFMSYAGLIILCIEVIAFLCWFRAAAKKVVWEFFNAIFTPIIVLVIVWSPVFVMQLQKFIQAPVKPPLLFTEVLEYALELLGYEAVLQIVIIIGFVIGLLFFVPYFFKKWVLSESASKLSGSEADQSMGFLGVVVVVYVAVILLIANFRNIQVLQFLLVAQPFICLLTARSVFFLWRKKQNNILQCSLLVLLTLIVVVVQQGANAGVGFFNGHRKPDLRPVVKAVAADEAFMNGSRTIFVSNINVSYYLEKYGVSKKSLFNIDQLDPNQLDAVSRFVSDPDFYYLDIIDSLAVKDSSPLLQAFSTRYGAVCAIESGLARLVKFNKTLPPVNGFSGLPQCVDAAEIMAVLPVEMYP